MTQTKNIETKKTARYFTVGSMNAQTKNIWLVLHGYGMNAEEFISQFKSFADEGDYIIAPEALSRFYVKGFFGTVGATWMTKEDRLNEIKDYTAYLHKLYEAEIKPNISPSVTIHLLGFSQGSSALCRYISYAPNQFHHLWVCAGEIPEDLDWNNFSTLLSKSKMHLLIGNNDEFITADRVDEVLKRLQQRNIMYDEHRFEGGHEIDFAYLQQFR